LKARSGATGALVPGPNEAATSALIRGLVNSVRLVGVSLAGTFDGTTFERPSDAVTFYRELRPISTDFEAKAPEINGLDREQLSRTSVARFEASDLGFRSSPETASSSHITPRTI